MQYQGSNVRKDRLIGRDLGLLLDDCRNTGSSCGKSECDSHWPQLNFTVGALEQNVAKIDPAVARRYPMAADYHALIAGRVPAQEVSQP